MGRIYTVVVNAASPAAVFDLAELNPNSAKPIRLRRLTIGQSSDTDTEVLGVSIIRAHSTSGSGGTAPTPRPLNSNTPAAGFGAEVMNTTQAIGGSPVVLAEAAFHVANGIDLAFSDEEAPEAVNGERLVVAMSAPADALTMRATLWVEECG
jgi:hypothetical protein